MKTTLATRCALICYFLFCLGSSVPLVAQDTLRKEGAVGMPDLPQFTWGQGFGIISPDSLYLLNIRFRMQNRLSFDLEGDEVTAVEARVRRLRLRFDGFVFTPRIRYTVQLAFASEDIGDFVGAVPNLLRDGMIYYQPNRNWTFGFGQTKLPGNRERVVSSGDLQLADRSSLNSIFNIDRDFGLQAFYQRSFAGGPAFAFKTAVTTGEGRNWVSSLGSYLSYTVRGEVLPFGEFTSRGDYFQGDLLREKKPKLSIGAVYNFNHGALRTAGQRGGLLFATRDITNVMADLVFKYKGFALSSEFALRHAKDPVTVSSSDPQKKAFVFDGRGVAVQGSYLFPSNYELVARYAGIFADEDIRAFTATTSNGYTIGANRYFRGHRFKAQADVTWFDEYYESVNPHPNGYWQFRFQVEIGI